MNYKLVLYVPQNFLETVKQSLFLAGAGRQGNYEECCWQVLGTGQFKPCEGSQPFIGAKNQLEKVPEWRVEMLVDASRAKQVQQALIEAHPYEEPAYEFLACVELV